MKRIAEILFIALLICWSSTLAYGYITHVADWRIDDLTLETPVVLDYMVLTPTTVPSDDIEGYFYWDAEANGIKVHNGTDWVSLDTASGVSLDGAYDLGSGITVDGDAVTLTVGASDDNSALAIVHGETSNNNDAFTIVNSGTGDAIQISPAGTSSGGLNVVAKAAGVVPLIILDGASNDWDGADGKGMLNITQDTPMTHAGATALFIGDSSTPIASAQGFLARFVHSGTARTNSSAVQIKVPATQPALTMNGILAINGQNNAGAALVQIDNVAGNGDNDGVVITHTGAGDALQITVGENDGVAQRNIAAADQTTSLAVFDGATNNWDGASNIGMVHITTDDPLVDTGASLLNVTQSGTPIASAEGFLARFIQSGTATATATAVEIQVKATQPALAVNGITKINGQNAAGATLFQVIGVGASGDADAMLISNTGLGNCLQVTPGGIGTGGVNVTALADSTVSMITLDGASNNWDGDDNIGQLTLTQDDAVAHTGATQLMVINGGTTVAAAEGFLARFVQHTGTAVTDAYAVEIETTATTPCLALNGQMSIAGQGATDGILLDIVSADTDDDTVQFTGVGSGDVLQITPDATAAVGIRVIAKASGTTSDIVADATAGWLGASGVGLVHIKGDSALTDNAATLLFVGNASGRPKDGAEGFLARFVDSGTARTTATAVYIETTNTTPALNCNNNVTIAGADEAGILLNVTGIDLTGDTDTIVISHGGDGDAIQVTTTEPDGVALNVICDAAQVSSAVIVNGTTGEWIGAATTGMIHGTTDGALVEDASMLRLSSTGNIAVANDGALIELIETGSEQATSYLMRIASTNNEALHVDDGDVLFDDDFTVDGDATLSGAITGDGGDVLMGYLRGTEEETTTAEQVLITDSGKIFFNKANEGATTYTLPDCAAGLVFHFVDNSDTGGDDVIIDPQSGDNIDHATNGNYIESVTNAYPQTITLVGLNATDWASMGRTGTWGTQ